MARLRFRSDWFLEISPQALYEAEFEAVIQQNVELLRDNAVIVPFKQTVYANEFDSARADLALIDKDYREWWVIEVELLAHDLHRHVLPQVRTLADGRYGNEHATALLRQKPNLDEEKLLTMMRGEQPQVLVVCNRYNEEWARELRSLGAAYIPLAFSDLTSIRTSSFWTAISRGLVLITLHGSRQRLAYPAFSVCCRPQPCRPCPMGRSLFSTKANKPSG